jgi:undecaprenyl-diphosphatase
MKDVMILFFVWIAIQIITESFPISSSTHLALFEQLFASQENKLFLHSLHSLYIDDFLHLATLLVYIVFFWSRWTPLIFNIKKLFRLSWRIVARTALASGITVIFYLFFSMYPSMVVLPTFYGLCITAILLLSSRWSPGYPYEPYTMSKALVLGVVQGFALLPGISRLGSTYVAARWLRLSPRASLEISCAIQVPLIVAAVLRSVLCLYKSGEIFQLLNVPTGLVMLVATIIAYYGLCLVNYMMKNNRVWLFSLYMIVPMVGWYLLYK